MNTNIVDVLLVEDNMSDSELILRELKKHHVSNSIFHVKDGQEALEYLLATGRYSDRNASDLPKLILLDIQMPKVNGMEVLGKIKADPSMNFIPVVMLTSSGESFDIKTCYGLGANSYIVKPLTFERFSDAIKNIGFYWLLLNQKPN